MFKAPKLGPTETHMCVTWDSSSGAAAIFMDGRKSVTKMYRRGHRIRSEGKVIIGQDPDNYLGSFDAKQSFCWLSDQQVKFGVPYSPYIREGGNLIENTPGST
ncbi:hypothetical protein NQZ68_027010 [Dissostichus eleginoides]|nr:hypothetical protein NQZ68_027010 [Dissostichus eleginoides]